MVLHKITLIAQAEWLSKAEMYVEIISTFVIKFHRNNQCMDHNCSAGGKTIFNTTYNSVN